MRLPLILLSAITIVSVAPGCSTAPDQNRSASECERLREQKRAQQDDGVLSAQDLADLRFRGC